MSHELSPVANGVGGLPAALAPDGASSYPVSASATTSAAVPAGGSTAIQQAISEANRVLEVAATSFRFAHDDATNQIVVSVLDDNTGQVIRQVPSPEQLSIAAHLRAVDGLFFNQRV